MSGKHKKKEIHKYYILIQNLIEEPSGQITILRGTLWIEEETLSSVLILVGKYEGEDAGILKQIPAKFLEEINYEKAHLLLAVPEPLDNRLYIINDPAWIQDGLDIKIGSVIEIFNLSWLPDRSKGTVRWKGRLPGKNGISFGIELNVEHAGKGSTDGLYRHKRLFKCGEDCGVFLSIFKIRLPNSKIYDHKLNVRPEVEGCSSAANATDPKRTNTSTNISENSDLKLNERMVWMSDEGPEFCTVKWIGTLPYAIAHKIVVGVEFDNPVGTGTGKYKGVQLFRAKRNHASLIPILGLLRASVYMSMMSEQQGNESPPLTRYHDFQVDQNKISTEENQYNNTVNVIPDSGLESHFENLAMTDNDSQEPREHNFLQMTHSINNPLLSVQASFGNERLATGYQLQNKSGENVDSGIAKDSTGATRSNPTNYSNQPTPQMYSSNSLFSNTDNVLPEKSNTTIVGESLTEMQGFKIGDRVKVSLQTEKLGTIKWIGHVKKPGKEESIIAGIEMDIQDRQCYTDGTFQKIRLFNCPPFKSFFIQLDKCSHTEEPLS